MILAPMHHQRVQSSTPLLGWSRRQEFLASSLCSYLAQPAAAFVQGFTLTLVILLHCLLQHKKHDSDVDDDKVAAAKAFLEQHLKQAAATPPVAAAALAAAGKAKDKGKSSGKGSEQEKPAGSLPAGTPLLTRDDYFEKSAEFTAWLQEVKHQYFNGR